VDAYVAKAVLLPASLLEENARLKVQLKRGFGHLHSVKNLSKIK
jgi:hypothetical protein